MDRTSRRTSLRARTAVATLAASAALALLVAACGSSGSDGSTTAGSSTTAAETSTTAATTTTASTTPGELPGKVVDTPPSADASVAVVGVKADDTLNVRTGPGTDYPVAFELDPTGTATATGTNRQLDDGSVWAEVTANDETGWANSAFLLQPGAVTDDTARLYPTTADRPSAETMVDLADIVAQKVASTDPKSTVTIVDGPSVGDLGEITIDVIGLGDDAIGGYRLHLFAQPDANGETLTLRTVESTVLCSRGVTGDGLCL